MVDLGEEAEQRHRATRNSLRVTRKALKVCHDRISQNESTIRQLMEERDKWKRSAETRVDTQMMAERIKLANSLGQLIEATTRAVNFVIGKECM